MKRFIMAACAAALSIVPFAVQQAKADIANPTIGEISWFAGSFAPRGWDFCNGQILAINSNTALFSILGTTYGGDGRTTFALPDMRGRSPLHDGNSSGPGLSRIQIGARVGVPTTTLTQGNLPAHAHSEGSHSHMLKLGGAGTKVNGSGAYLADTATISRGTASNTFADSASGSTLATGSITGSNLGSSTGTSGGSQSFNNYQPGLGIQCIIALQGQYPSRS